MAVTNILFSFYFILSPLTVTKHLIFFVNKKVLVPHKYSYHTNFNNNLSTQDRFDYFFLDYRDEFYWYIKRVWESNQLTKEITMVIRLTMYTHYEVVLGISGPEFA